MQRGSWPPRRHPILLTVTLLAAAAGSLSTAAAPVPADRLSQTGLETSASRPDLAVGNLRAWLLHLAEHLQPTVDDVAGAAAMDSCLHVQRRAQRGHGMLVVDSWRWITPTGAGAVVQTQVRVPAATGADPATDPQVDDVPRRRTPTAVTHYEPGALLSPVGDPVPVDARLVAARIDEPIAAGPPPNPPDVQDEQDVHDAMVVAVLADLVSIRLLDRLQRAAVLRVLAGLPTLATTEFRVNVLGRTAAAFRVAASAGAPTVTIDTATGQLLRYGVELGPDRIVLLFEGSRCGCPESARRPQTSPKFWPPVLIQPADAAWSAGGAPPLLPTPQPPTCPAASPSVVFIPVISTASTEATP